MDSRKVSRLSWSIKEASNTMGTQFSSDIETFRDKDFRTLRTFTGKDIRIARKACNLTQEQLADELKISVRAIEKWEHMLHCPTQSLHKELLDLFTKAQEILRQGLISPSQMENIFWNPPNCKPYNLVCKLKI